MGSTTPKFAFPYPAASDGTQTWTYWENLAKAIDTALMYQGATWTPVVTGGETAGLPVTVGSTPVPNSCFYTVQGKMVLAQAAVTLTAAASGGIAISLPPPVGARVSQAVGAARILSTPAIAQGGAVQMWSTSKLAFLADSEGLVQNAPSGARLSFSYWYERA